MKKGYALLILAVAMFGTAFLLPETNNQIFAEENTQDVSIGVPVLLSMYSTKPIFELIASPNTFKSDTTNIVATTNNAGGYSVTIGTYSTDNALNRGSSSDNIASLGSSETGTTSNFPAGKWGLSIGNTGTFSMVPTSIAQSTIGATGEPGTGTYTIAVGAKPNSDTASGTYSNILVVSTTANPEPNPTT